jgi:hypothetical protein
LDLLAVPRAAPPRVLLLLLLLLLVIEAALLAAGVIFPPSGHEPSNVAKVHPQQTQRAYRKIYIFANPFY